jgi:VanZ family protein
MRNPPRLRLSTWLAVCYTLFIVYGSLSPFSGWRSQGLDFVEVLRAPLQLTYTAFDTTINLLAYLPFGFLVCLTLRARIASYASVVLASVMGLLLSTAMEYLQMYLPTRTSSNLDILTNFAGTLTGSTMAMMLASGTRLYSRLTFWRHELFLDGKKMDFGLALLALWIFGQVNPSLPMLGNVFITEVDHLPFVTPPFFQFDPWVSSAVALNLLMLGTLLLTLMRPQQKLLTVMVVILALVAFAKFIAAAVLLKSWALLLWINSEAVLGMLLGALVSMTAFWLPRKASYGLGGAAALAYFVIVNFVLDKRLPTAAMSVYHWHYGHLLNFNGLAQSITMVFPLLMLLHLWRIAKR